LLFFQDHTLGVQTFASVKVREIGINFHEKDIKSLFLEHSREFLKTNKQTNKQTNKFESLYA